MNCEHIHYGGTGFIKLEVQFIFICVFLFLATEFCCLALFDLDHYVGKAELELSVVLLPQLPEHWGKRLLPPCHVS